jgi:Protein of unknown function (DUF3891)
VIVRYRSMVNADQGEPQPAFQVFLASQKGSGTPEVIALQTVHSKLAGDLARALRPEMFGELPSEVIDAAEKHDLGWGESDDRQMARAEKEDPKPFPHVGGGEELPSWQRSLRLADAMPLLTRILISRHFCALANNPSPQHAEFLDGELDHRLELERKLGTSAGDLKRWTDAVGLCDLMSLYLCSGVSRAALFPLAHPAEPYAADAKKITVQRRGNELLFSEPVFREGAHVSAELLQFDPASRRVRPVELTWNVA